MSQVYTGWFDGWQNAQQRRAINTLSGEISSLSSTLSRQRHEASQLRSQLSQLQGTLEQRVKRLTESLQALVELTDVRGVLAMFDAPALVRHRAREAITDLCGPDAAVVDLPPMPDDVPGYWLAPAVQAFVALVRGEDADAALAVAEERDRRRTAVLLTCGLTLAGRNELAQRWLPDAFGPLSVEAPVTEAQRTLWTVATAGGFGPAGEALLRQRLAGLVSGLTAEQEQAEQKAWLARMDQLPASEPRLPQIVRDDQSVQRCLTAGAKLAGLRAVCCAEPAPVPEGDRVDRERLTAVLHSLVDEGTPEEAPLLRRAAELRATIEAGEAAPPPAQWDSEAGSPGELLRTDAFQVASPKQAEAARQAGSRWLAAAASQLADEASTDAPAEVTVSVAGGDIRVRPTGADSWDLSRVRSRIEERPVTDSRADRATLILAIVGGVLLLAIAAWPNGLAVLAALAGVIVLFVSAAQWFREREARIHRAAQKKAELANVEIQVTRVAAELTELQQTIADTAQTAAADLAAIRARLAQTKQ